MHIGCKETTATAGTKVNKQRTKATYTEPIEVEHDRCTAGCGAQRGEPEDGWKQHLRNTNALC